MEIKQLKIIEENPILRGFENEPMTIEEIEQLEVKFNDENSFPAVFREFLFLAGNFNNFSFDDINGIEKLQKYAQEDLEAVSKQVDRPFFAFDVYNSQYSIIFLDDEKEDPDVFLLSPFLAKGGKVPLISPCLIPIFSDLINEAIRRVKNNLPM